MAYKSKAAWEAAIARFKKRGMSLEDIRKRVGFFEEGDKKFTVHSRSNEQGYEIIDRNQRNRRDKTRSEGIRASTPMESVSANLDFDGSQLRWTLCTKAISCEFVK